ncbi:putative alpha beta [Phaeomoniella chlamydospora]|uniref:Putative alpha beta n=1 Tax=Phaeomoniella chlamydospora TaxID=158046 RepID=A0A0G2E7B3_PHACM|nr:putative alpha beta [Phaeomoniella chlamydospora]
MVYGYGLDQTFIHKTPTHESHIRWTRFGNPTLPPLVFIHGTPWSSVVWRDLATSLSTRFNAYVYDHPGFGISPPLRRLVDAADHDKVDLDASLVLRAEASAALFKYWDLASPPHVVSHDNGGLVSLRLLLEHGLKFASLCLVDAVAIGPFGLPFFKLVAENENVFSAIPPHFFEGFVRAYVKSASYKSLPKEIEDILCAPWLAGGMQGSEKFLKEMVQAHYRNTGVLEHEYARVGDLSPTKIIWGKDDAWIPVETAERLKKALNAEQVAIIEETGHLVQYDQPGRLALEVGVWLTEHSNSET